MPNAIAPTYVAPSDAGFNIPINPDYSFIPAYQTSEITALASVVGRTVSTFSPNLINNVGIGAQIHLNITAVPTTPAGLTIKVYAVNTLTSTLEFIGGASTADIVAGYHIYTVYPGLANTNNTLNQCIGKTWAVKIDHGADSANGAKTYDYSVYVSYLL